MHRLGVETSALPGQDAAGAVQDAQQLGLLGAVDGWFAEAEGVHVAEAGVLPGRFASGRGGDHRHLGARVRGAPPGPGHHRLRQERVIEIDPWAVSVWCGRWYLLGWSHTSGARRVSRVDRVMAVEVLQDAFVPPDDLDPVVTIEEQMSTGWEHEVEIVVDAPVEQVVQWLPRSLGRLERVDDQRTRLVGSTGDAWWFVAQLVDPGRPAGSCCRPSCARPPARSVPC